MSEHQEENKTFKEDGIRPIESGDIQVADTFEEDGTRPIAKSPDFLLQNTASQSSESDSQNLDNNKVLEIDGKRPVDNSNVEVVDTFQADGERPIMANKYEIVDTLDIDGERPITSNNK